MKLDFSLKMVLLVVAAWIGACVGGIIKMPNGVKDIYPCYESSESPCKIVDYVSSTILPMDGEFAFVGSRVECFYAKGKAYLIVQSNAPYQFRGTVFYGTSTGCIKTCINDKNEKIDYSDYKYYQSKFYFLING